MNNALLSFIHLHWMLLKNMYKPMHMEWRRLVFTGHQMVFVRLSRCDHQSSFMCVSLQQFVVDFVIFSGRCLLITKLISFLKIKWVLLASGNNLSIVIETYCKLFEKFTNRDRNGDDRQTGKKPFQYLPRHNFLQLYCFDDHH